MKTKYKVKWKSYSTKNLFEYTEEILFDDIQWKEYGIRVTKDDETIKTYVIPYTSIYEIEIVYVED